MGIEGRYYKVDSSINRVTDEGRFVCKFLSGNITLLSKETTIPVSGIRLNSNRRL